MADRWPTHLRSIGADKVQIMSTAGLPVVYGDWLGAGANRQCLCMPL